MASIEMGEYPFKSEFTNTPVEVIKNGVFKFREFKGSRGHVLWKD